jgi:hypothetical protein
MPMTTLVTVAYFRDVQLARVARGRLEAQGIRATVVADPVLAAAAGGVELQVPAAELGPALAFLGSPEARGPAAARRGVTCPNCGADTVSRRMPGRHLRARLTVDTPWCRKWICWSCSTRW